jgi:Ca-activated chloride channel family protein
MVIAFGVFAWVGAMASIGRAAARPGTCAAGPAEEGRAPRVPTGPRGRSVAVTVDVSGSMRGDALERVKDALHERVAALGPDDRVSLVAFSTEATTLATHLAPSDPRLRAAIEALRAGGSTNVYAGLRAGLELASRGDTAAPMQGRVVLLSDGAPNAGVVSSRRILGLAKRYAAQGIAVSAVGIGDGYDVGLLAHLARIGAGACVVAPDPATVDAALRHGL